MNNIYNRTDEEFSVIGEVPANFIANDPLYKQGFQAGGASRDAEVDDLGDSLAQVKLKNSMLIAERDQLHADNVRLQFALAETEALELSHGEVIEKLRAQIDSLQETLEYFFPDWKTYTHLDWRYRATKALSIQPNLKLKSLK